MNDPYLLNHYARVWEINPELVPSSLCQPDDPLRIALQHILPPFGRKILRMDREHLQLAAVNPYSISGVASLIDMKRRQRLSHPNIMTKPYEAKGIRCEIWSVGDYKIVSGCQFTCSD